MLKRCCILGVLSLFIFISVVGQQSTFQNYGERDGLEHPIIRSVVMDNLGYTWIGTTEGLIMHDGNYFDSFKYSATDSLSLSDNNVNAIYVDHQERALWVGTRFGGVNRLNLKTFKFEHIQRNADTVHRSGIGNVKALLRLEEHLLIGTEHSGLQVYNTSEKTFYDIGIEGDMSFTVSEIIEYGSQLYFGTDIGVFKCSVDELHSGMLNLDKVSISTSNERVISMSVMHPSQLLICYPTQLIKYNVQSASEDVVFDYKDESSTLTTHIVDKNNHIWLGTVGNGLFELDMEGHLIEWHRAMGVEGELANDWITSLFYSDKHQMLWVGTKDGLSKRVEDNIRFKQVRTNLKQPSSSDDLFFLFKDSMDTYWWWTHDGLFFKNDDTDSEPFIAKNGQTFDTDTVSCGYEDESQTLWLGTFNGLLEIDIKSHQTERKKFVWDGCSAAKLNIIKDIKNYQGDLWMITYQGVIRYSKETGNYTVYPYPDEFKMESSLNVTISSFDNDGVLWIGDSEGYLYRFDTNSKGFKNYSTHLQKENEPIKYNRLMHIYSLNDSTLLLATYGTGLLEFDKKTNTVNQVFSQDLNYDNIYSIYEDENAYLWMNTNTRILRYNVSEREVLSFGKDEGTMCREFNGKAHFQDKKGVILMGGFGGFVEFNPATFKINTSVPNIDLGSYTIEDENVVIGGQVYSNWEYVGKDTLELKTGHKPISFYASVLDYQNPNKNLVAWQLQGYEETWDTLMSYSTKAYAALPAGTYTLKVKGSNNDQIWNDDGDEIVIIVEPTFIESRLFKGLVLLCIFLVVYSVYFIRIRYLSRQRKQLAKRVEERTSQLMQINAELEDSREEVVTQKQELERHRFYLEELIKDRTVDLEQAKLKAEESDRLKTAFLANLSHEIRTPMNSIVGFSTLLTSDVYSSDERKEFANVIQKSSDSLLVLINDIIDISRIETGQVKLVRNTVDVSILCFDVFKSLELNVNSLTVKYEIDVQLSNSDKMLYTDSERLKQILINLINNAIKFTTEGYVRLVVRTENNITSHISDAEVLKKDEKVILFAIEDSGLGIAEEFHNNIFSPFQKVENGHDIHGGIGLGLSIVKQLVEMLGGRIWLESKPNVGTTFYFYLPCYQS